MSRRRLQIKARPAVDETDVAPLINDNAGRCKATQQQPVKQRGLGGARAVGRRRGCAGGELRWGRRRQRPAGAPENFRLCVHDLEVVPQLADALGRPQKQQSVPLQGVMEERQQPALCRAVQIDEQVAAGDEVEFRERRVLADVLRREDDQFPDFLIEPIVAVFLGEEPLPPFARHVHRDAVRVNPGAGVVDSLAVQVRAENLKGEPLFHPLGAFPQRRRTRPPTATSSASPPVCWSIPNSRTTGSMTNWPRNSSTATLRPSTPPTCCLFSPMRRSSTSSVRAWPS